MHCQHRRAERARRCLRRGTERPSRGVQPVGYLRSVERPIAQRHDSEHEGSSFAGFKGKLTELAVEKLGPIGSEMQRWMNDPASIDAVLAKGAEQARRIADPVVDDVYDILGLLRANR